MKNLRTICRRGFQTLRLPWRRINMTLLQFFQFSTRYSFVHWQVSVSEHSRRCLPKNLIIFFCPGRPAQLWLADSWSVKHQPANKPNPGHTECHNCQCKWPCCMQSLNHSTLAMSSKPWFGIASSNHLKGDFLSFGRPPSRRAWWLLLVQRITHRTPTLSRGCPGLQSFNHHHWISFLSLMLNNDYSGSLWRSLSTVPWRN